MPQQEVTFNYWGVIVRHAAGMNKGHVLLQQQETIGNYLINSCNGWGHFDFPVQTVLNTVGDIFVQFSQELNKVDLTIYCSKWNTVNLCSFKEFPKFS